MKFKIVGDSCTDFTAEDLKKEYMVSVPLTIDVGGYEVEEGGGIPRMSEIGVSFP